MQIELKTDMNTIFDFELHSKNGKRHLSGTCKAMSGTDNDGNAILILKSYKVGNEAGWGKDESNTTISFNGGWICD